MIHKAKDLSPD
jgi:hypothetical protein